MSNDYEPLFPLFGEYWDKPLAELPEALQARVMMREDIEDKTRVIGHKPKIEANGNLISNTDGSYQALEEEYATKYEGDFLFHWNDLTAEQRRQQVVQIDDHNDQNSHSNTTVALVLYLGSEEDDLEGELGTMISNARSKGQSSVAVTLKELSDELALIVNTDIHRSFSDSSLWRELYRFCKKLENMKEQAKGKDDYDLALALDDVAMRIDGILDIDRERACDEVVAAIDAEATERVTPKSTIKTETDSDAEKGGATELPHNTDNPPCITDGMITITRLAITAAWQIECEFGRIATTKEVIKRLQDWVTSKQYAELIEIIPHGVKWMTTEPNVKAYDKEACGATLKSWHSNRKKLSLDRA